jgi:hypothetical protein
MAVLARQVLYLEIAKLERDAELQARVGLHTDVVKEYAEQMAGATFPPVLVFVRPGAWSLVDGFHRVAARESLGHTTVLAEIREGTREEAVWYGLTVNQKHGLRRSNDDKHRCVVKALTHARGRILSDRQLANHCGVHHYTVSRIRQQLERSEVIEARDTRVVTRGGVSYNQRLQRNRSSAMPHEARALARVPDVAPDSTIAASVAAHQPTPLLLPRRLDCITNTIERPTCDERVRQLIRQARSNLDEALREMSRGQCDADRKLKRLFLRLTDLHQELSSAADRLAPVAATEQHANP